MPYVSGSPAANTVMPGASTRKRKANSTQELTAYVKPTTCTTRRHDLKSLPVALQKCLIPFLSVRDQSLFSAVCQNLRTSVEDTLMDVKILKDLTLPIARLTLGRVNALITAKNPDAMIYMADTLSRRYDLCRRSRAYIIGLLNKSTCELPSGMTKTERLKKTRCIELILRMRLLGYELPDQLAQNSNLWRALNLETTHHRPRSALDNDISSWLRLWAFTACEHRSPANMLAAQGDAFLAAVDKKNLPTHRQIALLIGDYLAYLTATTDTIKQEQISKLQKHVNDAKNSDWYLDADFCMFTPLVHLAELTTIQYQLPQPLPETMQKLTCLCDNVAATPHIRALATLTLAYQQYLHPCTNLKDDEIARRLKGLVQQDTLQQRVHDRVNFLILLFNRTQRIANSSFECRERTLMILERVATSVWEGCSEGPLESLQALAKKMLTSELATRELFS